VSDIVPLARSRRRPLPQLYQLCARLQTRGERISPSACIGQCIGRIRIYSTIFKN